MTFKEVLKKSNEYISELSELAFQCDQIQAEMYDQYKVFRGLRDNNGVGVVTGLTEISEMNGFATNEKGERTPIEGEMFYRGINIYDFVKGFNGKRYGYEECAYLLLCGQLPNKKQLEDFTRLLAMYRKLPESFVRDIVLKAPSKDMMNALARSVLTLYSYDNNPDDISIKNVFRQSIQLIALMPMLAVYSYQAYHHYHLGQNLYIRLPKDNLSTAENILYLLKGSNGYTKEEAHMLDICMVLQAEHGGGNNSTFTTHVVTSSGTDTYSCVAASLASLKGPRHGGANLKVIQMLDDIMKNVPDLSDESISDYLRKILNKEAFDGSGLIYGLGHAVYSLSDPRANILHNYIENYMSHKYHNKFYQLYTKLQRLAPKIICENRVMYKGVSVNIDFYTGYVYRLLKIPEVLFTPIFAVSRIVGWSAHRLEELSNRGKIIRPAYIAVAPRKEYVDLEDRK